jgi:hypothetical protein
MVSSARKRSNSNEGSLQEDEQQGSEERQPSEPNRSGQENHLPCDRWRALLDQDQSQQDLPEKAHGSPLEDECLGKDLFHDQQTKHSDLKQASTLQFPELNQRSLQEEEERLKCQ